MAVFKLHITSLVVLLSILTFNFNPTNATRGMLSPNPTQSFAGRIEGEDGEGGGMMECWSALLELKSCTNEIIIFFVNGEGYIGMECCRAIRTITHHCWPSMLTSLGYTSEEGDVLADYCGGSPLPQPTYGSFGTQG